MTQEYKYIFTKHFDEHEVKVYGGRKDVVFECNNVCLILGISNDIIQRESSKEYIFIKVNIEGNSTSINTLNEDGLNKLISLSTTPEAQRFSEWITKVTKEALLILLQDKDDELVKYKYKKYEEVEKTGHLYIMLLDGGYKVGRTFTTTNKRAKGLQTGNVEDIQIIYDYETHNEDVLEKVVHYILARYRVNPKREFFDCKVEYMKMVIRMCGEFLDTFKSTCENIEFEEVIEKLNEKQFGLKMRECDAITIQNTENTVKMETTNDGISNVQTTSAFEKWFNENVERRENGILNLKDVCKVCYLIKTCTNKKAPPRTASKYRVQISGFIKARFPELKSEYQDTTTDGKRFRGWLGLQLKYKSDFDEWLHEKIVFKEGGVLKLHNVCKRFTGKDLNTHESVKYKKKIEDFIIECFPNCKHEHGTIKIGNKTYKGWKNLCIKDA